MTRAPPLRTWQLVAQKPVDVATIDFEYRDIKMAQLRDLILDEIKHYSQRRMTTGLGPGLAVGGGPSIGAVGSSSTAGLILH